MTAEQQQLIVDNVKLTTFVVKKSFYSSSPTVKDYLMGEAHLALINAALSYDPLKGQFSTWAVFVIRNHLLSQLKYYTRHNYDVAVYDKQLSTYTEKNGVYTETGFEEVDNQDYREKVLSVINVLPQRSQQVVKMRVLEDKPFHTIGERFDISTERARQIYNKSMDKLRQHANTLNISP